MSAPPFTYFGGKTMLADRIISLFPASGQRDTTPPDTEVYDESEHDDRHWGYGAIADGLNIEFNAALGEYDGP